MKLGRVLLEKRLAACINILPGMQSSYRWKGGIETAKEAVLIVKTSAAKAKLVERWIRRLHSYSCPCVLFLPISGGSAQYLKWLRGAL
jgi:periplasmic divalent cation tolerance protein